MGDVMRLSGHGALGIDHLSVGMMMAQAVGVTPIDDAKPPVREDLARFGMFVDSASRLGLSPEQTETVGREVNQTPDRRLTPETRTELIEGEVVKQGGLVTRPSAKSPASRSRRACCPTR